MKQAPQAGEIASFIKDEGQPVEYGEDVVELAPFFGGTSLPCSPVHSTPAPCLLPNNSAEETEGTKCNVNKQLLLAVNRVHAAVPCRPHHWRLQAHLRGSLRSDSSRELSYESAAGGHVWKWEQDCPIRGGHGRIQVL